MANAMSTSPSGKRYEGSHDRDGVAELAGTMGGASIHDASVWGGNEGGHNLLSILLGHAVESSMILHNYWGNLKVLSHTVEMRRAALKSTVDRSRFAVSAAVQAINDAMKVAKDAAAEGRDLAVSFGWRARLPLMVWMISFAVGDVMFMSVAMQILGLSDAAWIPGLPGTLVSQLTVATMSTVAALLGLAHFAGEAAEELHHNFKHRKDARGRSFAKANAATVATLGVCFAAGAGALLLGISLIRGAYLHEADQPTLEVPFIAVNLGIFVAAMAVSKHYAHPYRAKAAKVLPAVDTTLASAEEAVRQARESEASYRHSVTELEADTAATLSHIRTDRASVFRIAHEYGPGVMVSSPEPTTEKMTLEHDVAHVEITLAETILENYLAGQTTDVPLTRYSSIEFTELHTLESEFEELIALRGEFARVGLSGQVSTDTPS